MAAKKILIALTNHATLGNTGKPTGFWLSELTHPFFVFQRSGFGIDLISRKARMEKAAPRHPKVVVSERLVTGQNPASAKATGEKVLGLLRQ